MAWLGRLVLAGVITAAFAYHVRQLWVLFDRTRARRPHVFLLVKGDPDDRAKRRLVVLRNAGELPARKVSIRVTRDAMIWTNARGEPDPSVGDDRVPFSTLDVCRDGVLGIPPGGEHPVAAFLAPAGRFMQDREQKLECILTYFDGEGARYEESVGLEYLA
jgi:hypothetical protein